MKKLFVLVLAMILMAGCTTMQVKTTTLPTSGAKIDVLGVAYNNPLTQDLSVVTLFDAKGNPVYSANTGGPGIVKSTTANTTAGTTFGVAFPTKGDNTTNVNAGGTATGGAATSRSNALQAQGQGQLQGQAQGQEQSLF